MKLLLTRLFPSACLDEVYWWFLLSETTVAVKIAAYLSRSSTDERQLKAVMEFRKAYSAQALEGSNIPKVSIAVHT